MRSYFDALMHYFDFSGRTGRAQFWIYNLVVLLMIAAVVGYEVYQAGRFPRSLESNPLLVFIILFHAIPGITITVRRLHDTGRSGWWYLATSVPVVGLFVLYWLCCASEPGTNDHGPSTGASSSRNTAREAPEPYYARALRPSAASGRGTASTSARLNGPSERFI